MVGRPSGSKNTSKRGGKTLPQLLTELKQTRDELLSIKDERQKQDKTISNLQDELKQFKLGGKPKYSGKSNLSLTEDIIKDVGNIVTQGVFTLSRISGFLGINRNTFKNWVTLGESGSLPVDDLRTQLSDMIEYRKEIFYLTNQQVITKEVTEKRNWNAAKWNIESRFKDLETSKNDNTFNINNSTNIISDKDQKIITAKKEIEDIIQDLVMDEDDDVDL